MASSLTNTTQNLYTKILSWQHQIIKFYIRSQKTDEISKYLIAYSETLKPMECFSDSSSNKKCDSYDIQQNIRWTALPTYKK